MDLIYYGSVHGISRKQFLSTFKPDVISERGDVGDYYLVAGIANFTVFSKHYQVAFLDDFKAGLVDQSGFDMFGKCPAGDMEGNMEGDENE